MAVSERQLDAGRKRTLARAGATFHGLLTKKHGFLIQPTGPSAIIGERGGHTQARNDNYGKPKTWPGRSRCTDDA
jgi:hypothetical protein